MSNQVHDFRRGMWGHALHASTFYPVKQTRWQKLKRAAQEFTVMVHCSPTPEIGDSMIYGAADGDRTGEITGVKPCGNPRDMYTLQFKIIKRESSK